MSKRYTIAVDFDGVLHSYTSPWVAPHIIPDPPVPGAIEWLNEIARHFEVVIFTTRGKTWRGRRAVARWLWEAGYSYCCRHSEPECWADLDVTVTDRKPAALIYLDDRAVRFDGHSFPTKDDVHALRPWNKPLVGGREGR